MQGQEHDKDLEVLYIDKINSEVLPGIDFKRLDLSCNGRDTGYAAQVLSKLHKAFVEVYGTDHPERGCGFITAPAIIQGRVSKHMAVGLVSLDLESSGEHYGSNFFTPLGVIGDGTADNGPKEKAYIEKLFMPYDYWYTLCVDYDHHVDFDQVPKAVDSILEKAHAGSQRREIEQEPTMGGMC